MRHVFGETQQWKTNKQIQEENDKTQGFRRGKGSGSVYYCTKLTALDYVNGDDMRGPGAQMGEQGWVYYRQQTVLWPNKWGMRAIPTNYATVPGAGMSKSLLVTMRL